MGEAKVVINLADKLVNKMNAAAFVITIAASLVLCATDVFGLSSMGGLEASAPAVIDKSVASETSGLKITGNIPDVVKLENSRLQNELNTLIAKEYGDKLDAARKDSAKSIDFTYEYKNHQADGYGSIIMRTKTSVVGTKEDVATFVFSKEDNKIVKLKDVLGVNAIKIVNNVITAEMTQKPGIYNPGFQGITEAQSFYFENGSVFVIFNKFALGPAALGTPTFEIVKDRVFNFSVGKNDYHTIDPYSVKMIPLRIVCSSFGFDVKWDSVERTIEIARGSFSSTVSIGKNSYNKGKNPIRALEAAPELRGDTAYLPISFFELILDVCYTVDASGSVTFSYYQPPVATGFTGPTWLLLGFIQEKRAEI